MVLDRREFLGRAATAGIATTAGLAGVAAGQVAPDEGKDSSPRRRHPIGVSTYSFWQFRGERLGIAACIDKAAAMGFDGVEILHVQMEDESNAALQKIKRQAHSLGPGPDGLLDAPGVRQPRRGPAAHQRPEDALPDRPGLPPGHPDDADQHRPLGHDQVVRRPHGQEGDRAGPARATPRRRRSAGSSASIEKLLPRAEECGVVLGLENHWGLGRTAEGVLRIVEAIKSPWLQMTLDTGNFLERLLRADGDDGGQHGAARAGAGQDLLRRRPVVRARPRLRPDRRDPATSTATGAGSRWSSRGTRTPRPASPRAWRC